MHGWPTPRLRRQRVLDELQQVLTRALGRPVPVRHITPLTRERGNRAFRVEGPEGIVVVKQPNRGAGASLPTELEFAVATRVAAAGLGPRPLGYDPISGAIVAECLVDANPWTIDTAAQNRNIERIASLLQTLHAIRMQIRRFEPLRWADEYISSCPRPLAGEARELATELLELARGFRASEPEVLCHNDLVAANLLDDGKLWVIDFEYAVCGPPIVDLASFAAMNKFSEQQQQRLIAAYHTGSRPQYDFGAFTDAVRLHELLAMFWAEARDTHRRRD